MEFSAGCFENVSLERWKCFDLSVRVPNERLTAGCAT